MGRRRWGGRGELDEVRFEGRVAGRQLPLIRIEQVEGLLQDEDVFAAIVSGEGGDDLGLGRVTPIVPMLGELLRVPLAGDDQGELPCGAATAAAEPRSCA